MNIFRLVPIMALALAMPAAPQSARAPARLGQNAALRYWAAFAEMQDQAITPAEAKELNRILAGTAPYDDLKYKGLVEKNRAALRTMARGTELPYCDWGIDYQLGPDAPVDYVRKALQLGRLNVLDVFHLAVTGDKQGTARALAAGIAFSHDVANGGTLFSALVAKSLLGAHLRAATFLLQRGEMSAAGRIRLKNALAQIGPDGLDWQSAVKRELGIFRTPFRAPSGVQELDAQELAALKRIAPLYVSALGDAAALPQLEKDIAAAPGPLRNLIPNPKRVVDNKQDLARQIARVRSMLR